MHYFSTLFAFILAGLLPISAQNLLDSLRDIEAGELSVSTDEYAILLEQLSLETAFSKPDSSIRYAQLGLEHAREYNLFYDEILFLYGIGRGYYVKGMFSEAHRYFSDGLDLSLKRGEPQLISQGYNSLGTIMLVQQKYKDAIMQHLAGLRIAEDIKDTLLIIKHYFNTSNAYDDLRAYDSALFYANRTIDISLSVEDWHHLAMGYNRRAETYTHLRQYNLAVADHLQSLKVVPSNNTWEKAYAYWGLSRVYLKSNQPVESLEMGKISIELAKQIAALWELQQATKIVAEAFAALGQYDSAYQYHVLHKSYSDSIFSQQKEQEINALLLQRARLENLNLQQENSLKQETIRQNNRLVWIISFACLTIIVIAFILYRKSRQKHRFNLKLLEKNEEIRQQKEILQGMNRSKDKLLSIIAHDMKSPLNSLLGLIQMIKGRSYPPEEIDKISKLAEDQVYNIVNTLNNLIEWVQSQFKGETYQPEIVMISAIIHEQLQLWNRQIEQKQIKIRHALNTEIKVRVDLQHFKVIIRNLISNAVKYSHVGGLVEIEYLV